MAVKNAMKFFNCHTVIAYSSPDLGTNCSHYKKKRGAIGPTCGKKPTDSMCV